MRPGRSLVILGSVLMVAFAASPSIFSFSGGVNSSDVEYGCGGVCHQGQSAAIVEMWTPALQVAPGAVVQVTVNVTGAEASESFLGVMIVGGLVAADSHPSNFGWTIVLDPSGVTSYNYFQLASYSGQASLTWTLSAPSTEGASELYAREMHGGGAAYATDCISPLRFSVKQANADFGDPEPEPCVPSIDVECPCEGEPVNGQVMIQARINSTNQIAYTLMVVDGQVIDNKTSGPYTWTIDTTAFSDGQHVVRIIAVDADGDASVAEITLIVDNIDEGAAMKAWIATMVAGSLGIVAFAAVLILICVVLAARNNGGAL